MCIPLYNGNQVCKVNPILKTAVGDKTRLSQTVHCEYFSSVHSVSNIESAAILDAVTSFEGSWDGNRNAVVYRNVGSRKWAREGGRGRVRKSLH